MPITATTRSKLKTVAWLSFAGAVIGILYANLQFGYGWDMVIEGGLAGLLIVAISSATEIFFFSDYFKDKSYKLIVVVRLIFYLLLITITIIVVVGIVESIENEVSIISAIRSENLLRFLREDFPPIFLFSVAASLIINFMRQISIMLGWKVLMNVMLGRYKQQKSNLRIFMFLDIKSSTGLAEQLGAKKYSALLQDFFTDVNDPVLATGGEVYQYVGDEVVITWPHDEKLANKRVVDCFFLIREKMEERKEYYLENYGIVPDFKAGIHSGRAIVTEVGDLQKEVVYHGDVLNTASRLQSECNRFNQKLLVSKAFVASVDLEDDYKVEFLGTHLLRGKQNKIEIYTIKKIIKIVDEGVKE
jgi:adenylate cyclase